MKIRSCRSIHVAELSFEEFKLAEFSKDVFQFVAQDQLSCSQCENTADESINQDSALSFLVKYKADQLSDPKKIANEGIAGYFLSEDSKFNYRQEPGGDSHFSSVKVNHYNLYLTATQLEAMSLIVYSDSQMHSEHSAKDVSDYLLYMYQTVEWAAVLALKDKRGWKKLIKRILKKSFELRYGNVTRADLKKSNELDPVALRAELKKLNAYGCLEPKDLEEIRIALGKDALV